MQRLENLKNENLVLQEESTPEAFIYEWTLMNEYWNSFELTPEFLDGI